ncbi:MAG: sulfur oxidation c-type cytochrome SoxX [Gammaproteobacteria bacterium]
MMNRPPRVLALFLAGFCMETAGADLGRIAAGRQLAFAPERGNCLACHAIAGGRQMGNLGPALSAMRERFPRRAALRAKVWDAAAFNAETLMPPFGRHRILSREEIELVIDFLYSL